eukprot:TRINITY_DN4835_c0_g1_i2.p1 TRINITY_DN4835_c0_g1~~TRINITY_DN4835_c0_g1_i2.p1  ORF type:complete len:1883 (+),score=577.61 TRINITY_DN4835_c0_g1_i2:264-5912(+)
MVGRVLMQERMDSEIDDSKYSMETKTSRYDFQTEFAEESLIISDTKGSSKSKDDGFSQYFDEFFQATRTKPQKKQLSNSGLTVTLSDTLKSLCDETKLRTTIVGSKGVGKSFLINALLEATAPSDREYAEMREAQRSQASSSDQKLYNRITSYSFSSEDSDMNRQPEPSSPQLSSSRTLNTTYAFGTSPATSYSSSYGRETTYGFSPSRDGGSSGGLYKGLTSYSFGKSPSQERSPMSGTGENLSNSGGALDLSAPYKPYKSSGYTFSSSTGENLSNSGSLLVRSSSKDEISMSYSQATAYSFGVAPKTHKEFQWEVGEIEETFVPDAAYINTINWGKEKQVSALIDDDHCFLLPQGIDANFGPKCYDLRFGNVPELIVSFVEETKLLNELWKLHEVESGLRKLENAAARHYLESLYRAVLGISQQQRVPLAHVKSTMDFKLPSDAKSLLGKTYRFKGTGNNFSLDRIYVRQKLKEIVSGYGFYTTNILIKMPCKILEGNRELSELSGTEMSSLKVSQYIQNANVLVLALDKRGFTPELTRLMKTGGFLQKILRDPDQHRAIFLEIAESRATSNAPLHLSLFHPENKNLLEVFKNQVHAQFQQMLHAEIVSSSGYIERIVADSSVLSVRPRLYTLLSHPNSSLHGQLGAFSPTEAVTRTCVPALLACITNAALSKSAEPLKELNKSWMQKFNSGVQPLVAGISGLTLGGAKTGKSDINGLTEDSSSDGAVLDQLTFSFQEKFSRWKNDLLNRVKLMNTVLIPKARESHARSQSVWTEFRDKFLQTNEACRVILNPQLEGVALGANLNELTCGALLEAAPLLWNDRIAKNVPVKIEEMLNYSSSILRECAALVGKSHDANDVEEERLQRLLQFCKETDNRTITRFEEFKHQMQMDTAAMVKSACFEAVQSKILNRSDSLNGVKNYHELIFHALPEIPIAAAKNIQQRFSEKLQTDLKLLDVMEKDLQRAIRCILVVIKSRPADNPFGQVSAKNRPEKSDDAASYFAIAESYKKLHDEDMLLLNKPAAFAPLGLTSGPVHSGFDEAETPKFFKRNAWSGGELAMNTEANRVRCADQLKRALLKIVDVKRDGNCQFRALAHLVYGTEEAHAVVRLLLMSEILSNPSVYERYTKAKGQNLQEYVSVMALDAEWGDHVTLCAFANYYGSDLMVYSPVFTHPLLIQSRNTRNNRGFKIVYTNDNQYSSLTNAKEDEETETENKVMDENAEKADDSASNAGNSAWNLTTKWFKVSGSVRADERASKNAKVSDTELPTFGEVISEGPVRIFSPLSLVDMCVAKVVQYIDLVPCLQGAIPEELLQNILKCCVDQRKVDDSVLERLLEPSMQTLDFEGCLTITDPSCRQIARTCGNLRRIDLGGCVQIGNEALVQLAFGCPSLEFLNISGCNAVGNVGIEEIARRCRGLVSLNISGCTKITDSALNEIFTSCAGLVTFSSRDCAKLTDDAFAKIGSQISTLDLNGCELLTDSSLVSVAMRCRQLAVLKLSSKNLTDRGIAAIIATCKFLNVVELNGCELLTDFTVKNLLQHCRLEHLVLTGSKNFTNESFVAVSDGSYATLRILDLTRCLNVTDAAIKHLATKCDKLEVLNLSSCEDITDEAIFAVGEHFGGKNLQEVNLSKCMNVTDASVVNLIRKCGSKLRKLVLYNCHKITNAALVQIATTCSLLTELDVSSCQNLTDEAIEQVLRNCIFLEVLSFEECKFTERAIVSVSQHCYSLTSIKLARCKDLTDASLANFGVGCPNLQNIDISYCNNFTLGGFKKALACWPNLKSANLRGCQQLTTEGFEHPSLQNVNLSWCKNLQDNAVEQIAFGCPNLITLDLAYSQKITSNAVHKLAQKVATLRFLNLRGCMKVTLLAIKYLANGSITIYT